MTTPIGFLGLNPASFLVPVPFPVFVSFLQLAAFFLCSLLVFATGLRRLCVVLLAGLFLDFAFKRVSFCGTF